MITLPRTKAFSLAAAVIALAIWIVLWQPTEPCIRYTGLVLQLVGIFTATTALTNFVAWLLRRDIKGELSSSESPDEANLQGYVSDRTTETRLDFLETEIHKWITKGKEEAVQIATDLVKREEQSRLSADTEFRKHLEVTGRLSLIAAVWLSIGGILSTAPTVIEAMVPCFFRS